MIKNRESDEEKQFLEAIAADPNDAQALLVYGDYLQNQGSARGELIVIHAQMRELQSQKMTNEQLEDFHRLRERQNDLLADGHRAILPRLAKHIPRSLGFDEADCLGYEDPVRIRWAMGFIEALRITGAGDQHYPDDFDYSEVIRDVIQDPSCRFLQALALESRRIWFPAIETLLQTLPQTLVELRIGEDHEGSDRLPELTGCLDRLPRLRKLRLRGNPTPVGTWPKALEKVELAGAGSWKPWIPFLTETFFPSLRSLSLGGPHGTDLREDWTYELHQRMPKLDSLSLDFYPQLNGLIEHWRDGEVPQVRKLQIRYNLDQRGVDALLECARRFSQLDQVSIHSSIIDKEMRKLLDREFGCNTGIRNWREVDAA